MREEMLIRPSLPQVTVNTHKASLLSAAGSLVKSGVTGAGVTSLANTATRLFVKVLETEAHEGTLVMALEMLAAWANKISNEISNAAGANLIPYG